jgi:hypothetical protein
VQALVERVASGHICRLLESMTPSKPWLKRSPQVNVRGLRDSVTLRKLGLDLNPKINGRGLLGSMTL